MMIRSTFLALPLALTPFAPALLPATSHAGVRLAPDELGDGGDQRRGSAREPSSSGC